MSNPERATSVKCCLIQDEDSHWYIIPYSRKQDAEDFFEEFYRLNNLCEDTPAFPEWFYSIDGPHKLIFENWETK